MVKAPILVPSLFVLSLFLLLATTVFSHHEREDPQRQLQQCMQQCQESEHSQQPQCERRCVERYREHKKEHGSQGGEGDPIWEKDPQQQYQECLGDCRQSRQEQRQCERRCKERYEEQESRGGGNLPRDTEQGEQGSENPYFFDEQKFNERVRTEGGFVKTAERFDKRSELLRGIENYRIGLMEVNPNSFVVPNHWDADAVFFVARGRGMVSLLREDDRETVDIRRGDILRIPAGTTFSIVNKENNEKLRIIKLFYPVAIPGRYKAYFGLGGRDPESFFRSFSPGIVAAAFSTPWDTLKDLFDRQDKGAIIKASQRQIQQIGRHSSEGAPWPFGRGSKQQEAFNLFNKRPAHSSNRGQLYETDSHDYEQLRELDIKVSYANITGGSMSAPFYNSKVTKLSFVVSGNGYFEMACPHLSTQSGGGGGGGRQQPETEQGQQEEGQQQNEEEGQEEQEGRVSYQKVRSRLSPNTMFVAPAGHPVVIVSSGRDDLELICFEVNAKGNQRYYLTGKNAIYNQMEDEEIELAFNQPAREPRQIFKRQGDSILVKGPEEREDEEGGRGPLESILDFTGF